jgi:hypothetical protein
MYPDTMDVTPPTTKENAVSVPTCPGFGRMGGFEVWGSALRFHGWAVRAIGLRFGIKGSEFGILRQAFGI